MADKRHADRPLNKRFAAGALIRHADANGAQRFGLRAGRQPITATSASAVRLKMLSS
jgi:hypothetical protein